MSDFTVTARDGAARAGILRTAHGDVRTPVFMPVGTKATVKAVDPDELHALGAQIILGNTYHLHLRPGEELIAELGGLHAFMGWDGPILTDSGGFQVFSLRDTLLGATTTASRSARSTTGRPSGSRRSSRRGSRSGSAPTSRCASTSASPPALPRAELEEAVRRTTLWAERQRDLPRAPGQLRFAITQGGLDLELRGRSSAELVALDFDGYAIGGLSVGEHREPMFEATTAAAAFLPEEKPRYFMGIGDPEGVLEVIARGVDMFDCVLPTRTARTGSALDERGPAQPPQRPLRARRAAARGRLRLPRLLALQPRVHPAPRQPAGNPRAAAAQSA